MQDLINKLQKANSKRKCQLAAEVYEHVSTILSGIENKIDQIPLAEVSSIDFISADFYLDGVEQILNMQEALLYGLNWKEVKEIRENIINDYKETIEIWKFYEILNPDGKTYTADYDGRAEAGHHGQNSPAGPDFRGQKFEIPTIPEVLSRLRPAHMKLYQKMKMEGLKPKLQITPIAYNIRTLAKKIDARRAKLKINIGDLYVWKNIKDEELQYAPNSIKAIKGGKEIEIKGGKAKSEWVKTNGGFLIDIVSTKESLAHDEKIQINPEGKVNYNAIQVEKYIAKAKQKGFAQMSYESYLLAQMRALSLDEKVLGDYILLLDSNLENGQYIAYGALNGGLRLDHFLADSQGYSPRILSTVRVK